MLPVPVKHHILQRLSLLLHPPKTKTMKISDKIAMLAFAFMPWILVVIMQGAFVPGPEGTALQQTIKFVGVMWVLVSPIVTILIMKLVREETRE